MHFEHFSFGLRKCYNRVHIDMCYIDIEVISISTCTYTPRRATRFNYLVLTLSIRNRLQRPPAIDKVIFSVLLAIVP